MKKIWTLGIVAGFACASLLCSCGSKGDSSSSAADEETLAESSSSIEDDMEKSSSSESRDNSSSSKKKDIDDDDDFGSGVAGTGDNQIDDVSPAKILSSSSVVAEPTSKKACNSISNADKAFLAELNNNTFVLFKEFVSKNLDAMAPASSYKASYKTLMDKYVSKGEACPAITMGYGITFLADVLNEASVKELRSIFDNYNVVNWRSLNDRFVTTWLQTIRNTSLAAGGSFTAETQKTLRKTVIPALDSAIKYYSGIVKIGDFEYEIESDDYLMQVDQSDFALTLGMMYIAKGFFMSIASVNLELAKDGSYEWTTYYNAINRYRYTYTSDQLDAMQHVATLLSGETGLSAVIAGQENAWKSIPSILQMATASIRKGLQHCLNDDDQDYDVFVVGDDANADFSSGKIQQYIHAIDALDDALVGNYSYEYKNGKSVTINLQKIFAQTDGFVKYMPKLTCSKTDCYFVDLDGNATISLYDVRRGNYPVGKEASYFFFQDPTFGGVFPRFTQQSAWDFINTVKK